MCFEDRRSRKLVLCADSALWKSAPGGGCSRHGLKLLGGWFLVMPDGESGKWAMENGCQRVGATLPCLLDEEEAGAQGFPLVELARLAGRRPERRGVGRGSPGTEPVGNGSASRRGRHELEAVRPDREAHSRRIELVSSDSLASGTQSAFVPVADGRDVVHRDDQGTDAGDLGGRRRRRGERARLGNGGGGGTPAVLERYGPPRSCSVIREKNWSSSILEAPPSIRWPTLAMSPPTCTSAL